MWRRSETMYELTEAQYTQIRPLFAGLAHSRAMVFSLLERNHAGRVFADQVEIPRTAFLALACEFWHVAGDPDNETFLHELRQRALSELRPHSGQIFLFPPDDAWQRALQALFSDLQPMVIARTEFELDVERFAPLRDWEAGVPHGYRVQGYNCTLAAGVGLEEFWGGLDRFLARGYGFAVLCGDEVISRCHTVMVGDDRAEIGVETSEPYRRQGLGTLAARALIDRSLELGIQPAWSCWSINTASIQMAQKLGFVARGQVPVLYIRLGEHGPEARA